MRLLAKQSWFKRAREIRKHVFYNLPHSQPISWAKETSPRLSLPTRTRLFRYRLSSKASRWPNLRRLRDYEREKGKKEPWLSTAPPLAHFITPSIRRLVLTGRSTTETPVAPLRAFAPSALRPHTACPFSLIFRWGEATAGPKKRSHGSKKVVLEVFLVFLMLLLFWGEAQAQPGPAPSPGSPEASSSSPLVRPGAAASHHHGGPGWGEGVGGDGFCRWKTRRRHQHPNPVLWVFQRAGVRAAGSFPRPCVGV